MTPNAILAIDQGTTSTKALLVDIDSGVVIRRAACPVGIRFPRPGWVEQDADEIWDSVLTVAQACRGDGTDIADVVGIAIANQRESVVAWSATTGQPIGPVLGWQDSRTHAMCAALAGHAELISARTGLPLDPMYSASKMRWLVDFAREQGMSGADLRVGTLDSWLVYRLTGRHLIEAGNASRTLLLDIDRLAWDPDLLELFGVPGEALPTVVASTGDFGPARGVPGVGAVPVAAVVADSHAAFYHHGLRCRGFAKVTYGTGSSVMVAAPGHIRGAQGIATTVAWVDKDVHYAFEGNILTSGAGLDWVAGLLGGPDAVPGGAYLTELARGEASAGGTVFVPAFTGLSAPYWDRQAVATLAGMTGSTTRAQVARAALESVAHQVCDVISAMCTHGLVEIAAVVADGGATASDVLMQAQADLLGRTVTVAPAPEASALGAAQLAATALGASLPPDSEPQARYDPAIDSSARARERTAWSCTVRQARGLARGPNPLAEGGLADPDSSNELPTDHRIHDRS